MGRVSKRGIGGGDDKREPAPPVELSEQDIADIRDAAEEWARLRKLSGDDWGLTEPALKYLFVATQTMEKSPRKIADIAGVDFKAWYRWKDRTEWKNAVDAMFGSVLSELTLDMIRTFRKAMQDDDAKIALAGGRTVAEIKGLFVQRVETTRVEKPAEQRNFERAMQERIKGKQEPKQLN